MGAAAFPSPDERTAATALLLLLGSPADVSEPAPPPLSAAASESLSLSCFDGIVSFHGDCREELSSCISDSSSSTAALTFGPQIHADPLRILAFAAFFNGIKPKYQVVKKARSKIKYNKYIVAVKKEVVVESEEETEVSSLSSSASTTAGSGAGSGHLQVKKTRGARKKAQLQVRRKWWRWLRATSPATPSVRRRAEAIRTFLSAGSASEVRIREALGDSPDTSKALRMLLKLEEVKRSGAGGRRDPFVYTVCA